MKKHFTAQVIFATLALASQQAFALGFGRANPSAVLGLPLTFSVPVRVEPGERFGSDCVRVDVYFGEVLLPSSQVETMVEPQGDEGLWLVRVVTTRPVEEPVVELSVSAGCARPFMRRFTAFADPPRVLVTPSSHSQGAAASANNHSKSRKSLNRALRDKDAAGSAPRSGVGDELERADRRSQAAPGSGPRLALVDELNGLSNISRVSRREVSAVQPEKSQVRIASASTAPRLVLDSGFALLKMDVREPMMWAVNSAGAGVALAPLGDEDSARQLQMLQRNIDAMKRENQLNRERAAKLELELSEARTRGDWLPYILVLLGLLAVVAGVLVWRLRQLGRLTAQSHWFSESSQNPSKSAPGFVASHPPLSDRAPEDKVHILAPAAMPLVPENLAVLASGDDPEPTKEQHQLSVPDRDALVQDWNSTRPLSPAALLIPDGAQATDAAAVSRRELSVEELMDIEQQADFFIALDEQDAAIDLLMSHLRSAGGQSPLPYTKLLEIYRRRGDRDAYERLQARFNRRFNAYAPDWDVGPGSGRLLEDYPATIARLQALWNVPLDVMAELEALLFRRDKTDELFDLPAYRDVLVLYSLARDLWQQAGGGGGSPIDVLLPLEAADIPISIHTMASGIAPPAGDHSGHAGVSERAAAAGFQLTDFNIGRR